MRLTKDEARILAAALNSAKFEFDEAPLPKGCFDAFEDLEARLTTFGKDKRRSGRTSQNDWSDLLKRFSGFVQDRK